MAKTVQEVRPVLAGARSELMSKANVVGTGIGYKIANGQKTDELAIICSVEVKKPVSKLSVRQQIPSQIEGVTTDVVPTGPFTIFQDPDPTSRFRPAPGGVSIGHFRISAGTLGCLVQKSNSLYILSNNHVLANSNAASEGDPVLQPGTYDGGQRPRDEIARLAEFVPIHFENGDGNGDGGDGCPTAGFFTTVLNALAALADSSTRLKQYRLAAESTANKVDAAIAQPNNSGDVIDEILEIGTINGIAEGGLGMEVQKSGRTTGFTTGAIAQVDVTARVNYGAGKTALFEDQLQAGAMSQGGDSGSAVLDQQNNLVGLLFAGSNTTTLINRIQNVFSELDLELPGG